MQAILSYEIDRIPKRDELEWGLRSNTLSREKKYAKTHQYLADTIDYQQKITKLSICRDVTETVYDKFNRLLAEWRNETAHLSSIKAKVMVPSYLSIIGMGQPALRLILNELKQRPGYLFPALRAITGVDPVQQEDKGKLKRMANAWIEWGRQHNIIE